MTMICKNCGTVHSGEHVLPGNGWIELVLWLAYIVPGLIYSIWRRSRQRPTCAACGSRDLVDAETPVGRRLAAEHYPQGMPAAPRSGPVAASERPRGYLVWVAVGIVAVATALPWLAGSR
jgi:hypothetical protein